MPNDLTADQIAELRGHAKEHQDKSKPMYFHPPLVLALCAMAERAIAQPDNAAQLAAVTQERDSTREQINECRHLLHAKTDTNNHYVTHLEATNAALRTRLSEAEKVTPEMIAAAWKAFRGERQGPLGSPGPAFKEAIDAAFAARAFVTPPSKEGEGK